MTDNPEALAAGMAMTEPTVPALLAEIAWWQAENARQRLKIEQLAHLLNTQRWEALTKANHPAMPKKALFCGRG